MAESIANTVLQHVQQFLHLYQLGGITDGELLHRYCTDRDDNAFAALVVRHGAMVLGVCRRLLHQPADIEDAFQAVFLILVRKASSLPSGSLANWLYTVTCRLALRVKVRTDRSKALQRPLAEMPGPASASGQGDAELREVLDAELQQLPEKYRAPLILCYLEGRTCAEAAQHLGWKDGTLSGRLARAKELLRQRLLRRGLQLAVGAGSIVRAADASAAVPAALATSACQAAGLVKAGQAVAGGSSDRALLLAEEMLRTMTTSKLKVAAGMMLAVSLLSAGTGLALHVESGKEPDKQMAEVQNPKPVVAHPPEESKKPRVDQYGDPLPDGCLARFGSDRFRPARDSEHTIAFSHDLKTIAWQDYTGRCVIADVATGKHLRQWAGKCSPFGPLSALSADAGIVAAVDGRDIAVVWDVATGKEISRIKGAPGDFGILQMAIASDGRFLATANTGKGDTTTISICEIPSGKERLKIATIQGMLDTLRYSPDGKVLVSWGHDNSSTSDGGWAKTYPIMMWDVATGKELCRLDSGKGVVHAAFSPDSRKLFWTELGSKKGEAGATHVVDVTTGKERMRQFRGPDGPLAISPDSKTLVARTIAGGELGQWDTTTGKQIGKFKAYGSVVALAADGKTLAAAGLGEIQTWDTATGKQQVCHVTGGHLVPVLNLIFGPDGKTLFSGSYGALPDFGELISWDVATTRSHFVRLVGEGNFRASIVGLSADGKQLAVHEDQKLRFLDSTMIGVELRTLDVPPSSAPFIALSPDAKLVASWGDSLSEDRDMVLLLDAVSGKELRRVPFIRVDGFSFSPNHAKFLAFSPDCKILAVATAQADAVGGGCFNQVQMWDVSTGKKLQRVGNRQDDADITRLTFTPDGRSLLTEQGSMVRVWELATCKPRHEFPGKHFTLSLDGRYLATLSPDFDATVTVWDLVTGRKCHQFTKQPGVCSVAFSPDGSALAIGGSETTVKLWDLRQSVQRASALELDAKAVETLWAELVSSDAAQAYRAVGRLVGAPRPVLALFRARLKPLPAVDDGVLAKLLADLDSKEFSSRQKAEQELEKLGDFAIPALKRALQGKPSLELRQRVQQVLTKLENRFLSVEELRTWRVMEVLEHIATPEAEQILEKLAQGAPAHRITEEAKASLQRLAKRPTAP